jgi:adenylate cyclase
MSPSNDVDRAFLIADLCGYTALTESHGNRHAVEVIDRYQKIAESVLEARARIVERVGDELLIAAREPVAVVATAVRLLEAVERELHFPTLRAGLHAGPVAAHGGRYVGAALNLASRVAAHARGGQILCTEPVAIAAREVPGLSVHLVGSTRFRNVATPVQIFEVEIARGSRADVLIDPVCRMQVQAETAPARLPFAGRTFYFCSLECARSFAENPERHCEG